jgi:DNA-binding winged helix-turn-helix (wHTH) protein
MKHDQTSDYTVELLSERLFSVGDADIDPSRNIITRNGREHHVEPRVMSVLVRLAAKRGTVVARSELFEIIWADKPTGEEALTQAVSRLRRALGDSSRAPRVIETAPKTGYRLIGEVQLKPALSRTAVAAGFSIPQGVELKPVQAAPRMLMGVTAVFAITAGWLALDKFAADATPALEEQYVLKFVDEDGGHRVLRFKDKSELDPEDLLMVNELEETRGSDTAQTMFKKIQKRDKR